MEDLVKEGLKCVYEEYVQHMMKNSELCQKADQNVTKSHLNLWNPDKHLLNRHKMFKARMKTKGTLPVLGYLAGKIQNVAWYYTLHLVSVHLAQNLKIYKHRR